MTTTNLFVELVVIGVGAACWVGMLILGVFGVDFLRAEMLDGYPALVGLLAMVYVLGIISDRAADYVFDKLFSGPIRAHYFSEKREYQDARRLIVSTSDRLADMHDYGRTRIRICRGWSVNAAMMAVCLNFLLAKQFSETSEYSAMAIFGTLGLSLLSLASWWSWHMLCSTEYLKIKEHADYLREKANLRFDRMAA